MSLSMGLDVPEKPKIKEIDFRRQLVGTKPPGLAAIFGWEHCGWRPAMTKFGWRTPGTGTMAAGWPDLVLARARDRRLIFAELKSDTGRLSPDQVRVLDLLRCLETKPGALDTWPRIEVHVWRPADLEEIADILR